MSLPASRIDWNRADIIVQRPGLPDELHGSVRLLVLRDPYSRRWTASLSSAAGSRSMALESAEASRSHALLHGEDGEAWEARNLGCGCG